MAESPKVQTLPLPGSSSLRVLCQGSQSVVRGHRDFVGEGHSGKAKSPLGRLVGSQGAGTLSSPGTQGDSSRGLSRGGWVGGLPSAPLMLSRRASGLKVFDVLWLHRGTREAGKHS